MLIGIRSCTTRLTKVMKKLRRTFLDGDARGFRIMGLVDKKASQGYKAVDKAY